MKLKTPAAIRISVTPEVGAALKYAKKRYPTLSDPEILKLGLSLIVNDNVSAAQKKDRREIMAMAAESVGADYLNDPEEDIYTFDMGKKVDF